MAVFLGSEGCVELKRTQVDEDIFGTVQPSDVNANKNRFSFDYPLGMLITGDRVEIKTTDSSDLDFVDASGWPDNRVYPDGIFFLNVDELGAIRLYHNFDDALSGEPEGRIPLNSITRNIPIEIEIQNNVYRILGQVRSFELNTEREAVDVSALSDEFRKQYSGLISGSGQINCFFEYEKRDCDPMLPKCDGEIELPIYMNQLILRTRLGSEFHAKLTLISRGPKPYGDMGDINDTIWYEFDARLTNVGMSFEPTQPIESTIDFVTTGEIKLLSKFTGSKMLQEDLDAIHQEANQDPAAFIDLEQED